MSKLNIKSTVSRRSEILEELNSKGQVSVIKLSKAFHVSEVTIRNDLVQLEKQNMLIRARGGAFKLKFNHIGIDSPLSEKGKKNFYEKQKIGKAAVKLIKEGDTIIIDSGTTTMELAQNLQQFKDLTIITNALNIASVLAENNEFNIFMPGGILRNRSLSLVGSLAEESFSNYFCDKLFLGVDGFDTKYGLSTPNVEEAHMNLVMINLARKVIVMTDSSKFSRRRFAFIAPLSKIDVVITDHGISEEDKQRLESSGIEVIIV